MALETETCDVNIGDGMETLVSVANHFDRSSADHMAPHIKIKYMGL